MLKIVIWKAKDKFDNPSRSIYGERVLLSLEKPNGRRNRQLVISRQFKDYFEWHDISEDGKCKFTATRKSLYRLIESLKNIMEEAYGKQPY